jgi:hypothetical protein
VPAHLKSHSHLDIRIELAEDRDHPVEREAAKLRITDAGKLGMRHAGQSFGLAG